MKKYTISLLVALFCSTLVGQEYDDAEVIMMNPFVVDTSEDLDEPPVVLKRRGDFLLLSVEIFNDSRDAEMRSNEIKETLKDVVIRSTKNERITLRLDGKSLSLDAVKDISVKDVRHKKDTSFLDFYLKVPVNESDDVQALIDELKSFVIDSKTVGRTEVDMGDIGLSLKDPQQYRDQLLKLISEDYKKIKALFDSEFQILVHGLDSKLRWRRVSVSEIELYIPYRYEVLPSKSETMLMREDRY